MGLDIGLDAGTTSTLAYTAGKGLVINEPSVVAVDVSHDRLQAVGSEAHKSLNLKPNRVVEIRPIKNGVISDFGTTSMMLKQYIGKICKGKVFKPGIAVVVPCGLTDIEERGIRDAVLQAGAGKVCLVEAPLAAAVGAGLKVSKPTGTMVIDFGGGTTDIAIISCFGIVNSTSVKGGGEKINKAIIKYIRNRHGIIIGDQTAETIKLMVGSAVIVDATDESKNKPINAKGQNAAGGTPEEFTVKTNEIAEAVDAPLSEIVVAIKHLFQNSSPELIADINNNGIFLTGGGSRLSGLDKYIEKATGIKCTILESPVDAAVKGAYKILAEHDDIAEDFFMYKANRRN